MFLQVKRSTGTLLETKQEGVSRMQAPYRVLHHDVEEIAAAKQEMQRCLLDEQLADLTTVTLRLEAE